MQSNSSYLLTSALVEQTLYNLYHLIRRYMLFHTVFIALITLQLLSLLFLIPLMAKNIAAAAMIAMTFLTTFTYLVLRFYFQSRKIDELILIKETFIKSAQGLSLNLSPDSPWSLDKLGPIYHLIHSLHYKLSPSSLIPVWVQMVIPGMKPLAHWCLWEDSQWMKETLHQYAILTMLEWVKLYPLDLELHKTLATAYMACYAIYQLPLTDTQLLPLIARQYALPEMKSRFEKIALLAREELKVLLHHESQDEWALHQMAKIYHDLGWKEEEKKVYETLLSLEKKEAHTLYSLGLLCFELGDMAQGLYLYHELQKMHDPKADELIMHYRSFSSFFLKSEEA
ncbi:tetratricopeptide repeat protein [Rhabdochlamydiaceae symbiont of Dictyostelium giganteum]|uniref:tetratricopeptide repeat protein n=1 Tax=Rhabdochlamydiaceae symbiont of Dictyostelium giganteum TaxID=3342349 RepID=UPI0038506E4D